MPEFFADISEFQPEGQINWSAYVAAGRSRVSLRRSQGIGVPDAAFVDHYANSYAAGVRRFVFYHFAYPWLHPGTAGAQAEAAYFVSMLPNALGPEDILMGDFEAFQGNSGPASWYADFQDHVALLTGLPPARIWTYSYLNYIQNNLQDTRLANYPLVFSYPTMNPDFRPACPGPWSSYAAIQYTTSSQSVPGMTSMSVDDNILIEAAVAVPTQEGGSKMLIKHPTSDRVDLFYVNGGLIYHVSAPDAAGLANNLTILQRVGSPGSELVIPETVAAVWNSAGDQILVTAAGATSGIMHSAIIAADGSSIQAWLPVADGVSVDVPAPIQPGEPLAEKIDAALKALAAEL